MRKITGRFIFAAGLSAVMMLAGCRSTEIIESEEKEIAETVYQLRVTHRGSVDGNDSAAERVNGEELPLSCRFRVELTAERENEGAKKKNIGKLTAGKEKESSMARVYSGDLSVGEFVMEGYALEVEVDSYDAQAGEGTVNGEFIAVEAGLVDVHTNWKNLPFTEGECIFLGGEKSHREEMERSYDLKRELLERYEREE